MADYLDVAFWALVGGLFSITGGALLLTNKKIAMSLSGLLLPFAAGALLGAALFDLLPEAVELGAEGAAFRWVAVGIVVFFLLEHYLHWFHHHHEHDGEKQHKPTTPLIIIGDTLHNAIDGVAIGAAFVISPATGIVTAIAVAAHEIPQEVGDFGVLLKSGMRRLNVLIWNAVSALATLVTALYTFHLGSNENLPLGAILGLAAGFFIYIAASDLIPTIHEEAKGRFTKSAALLIILGLLVVGIVTDQAHEKLEETGVHDDSHGMSLEAEDNSHKASEVI
jgi:zinc and cadmium transporter